MICVQWCDKITGRWATDAHVFQSTHPVRGATAFATSLPSRSSDFNPRTPCGVRQQVSTQQQPTNYFNPRTPCGVRRSSSVLSFSRRCHFNQRTPCGVRPDVCILITLHVAISIHAPHAGCDPFKTVRSERLLLFQSTHPMRGATSPSGMRLTRRSNFNPRTPCGVRRCQMFIKSNRLRISIHAPHAGCDPNQRGLENLFEDFNPRTPCGVRHCSRVMLAVLILHFNPRTPCGVRP